MYSSNTMSNNRRSAGGDSSSSSTTTTMTTTQSGIDNEDSMMMTMDHEQQQDLDLRRGPWTDEEDHLLATYIANHGEGRWNSLAHAAGLKRNGKSCRLRWLNYLRPDVRRGNITPEEQLMILELHSQWGNRWSKIAQYLPGRTDNEIKNYWRTRVQKQAKQLRCDVNSKLFKDTMRNVWMPRLAERIQAAADGTSPETTNSITGHHFNNILDFTAVAESTNINDKGMINTNRTNRRISIKSEDNYTTAKVPASSSTADSLWTNMVTTQIPSPVSDLTYDQYQYPFESNSESTTTQTSQFMYYSDYAMTSPSIGYNQNQDFNFQGCTTSNVHEQQNMSNSRGSWLESSSAITQDNSLWDYLWNPNQDIMFLQQQQF
ncbi:hypothetical protein MKX01_011095 [Papaver californicum]|nr:hypothetical protein MKX01_036171 [Papaver californicum]KAI3987989.1 hypothetical protein MKX01_011095 [Papaver californicum]